MRERPTIVACFLIGLASLDARAADAPKGRILPYELRKSVLDNGLTIVSIPFDSPGIIAYYTAVRAGSRNEIEPGLSGFAHFFEHMMFRGTKRFSQEAYNNELKRLGADSNAFTTDDWTCYHMTIPASALEKAVELESDRFQNLEYDEPSFQKEARAVLGEYNKSASSPMMLMFETMQGTAYSAHTYRHTTIGFLSDVKDMPNQFAYSKTFFDRWYRPENCAIVVAGDVDHARLVEAARKGYGGWKRGKASVSIPVEPEQRAEKYAKLSWPLPTLPTLFIGYHIPAADPSNPDSAALGVLAQALFGDASPLYRTLVLDEQKVVSLQAEAEAKRDPGLFMILARVRDAKEVSTIQERIAKAIADAAKSPIEAKRLEDIKAHLRYEFAASLESADAVARAVGQSIATTGRPDALNDLYAAYDRVTPADLQRIASKYFAPSNRTVVTLETETKK